MHAYEDAGDEVPIMRKYNYEGHNYEGITVTRMCSTSTRLIHIYMLDFMRCMGVKT